MLRVLQVLVALWVVRVPYLEGDTVLQMQVGRGRLPLSDELILVEEVNRLFGVGDALRRGVDIHLQLCLRPTTYNQYV